MLGLAENVEAIRVQCFHTPIMDQRKISLKHNLHFRKSPQKLSLSAHEK